MKALIVKKIVIETKDIDSSNGPIYTEAIPSMLTMMAKDNELPTKTSQTVQYKRYELSRIHNPETKETKNYFVNTDDHKLWNELIKVSEGFINSRIDEGITKFKEMFFDYDLPEIRDREYNRGISYAKSLPFYKRLFNKF